MRNGVVVHRCFVGLLATGVCLIFLGAVFVPVLHHFQLDHVLTAQELADEGKRVEILALLKKANRGFISMLTVAGIAVAFLSCLGLRAAARLSRSNED